MAHRTWLSVGMLAMGLWAGPVSALQVQKISPQGVVNEVRQVVLRTDQDAVRFGDPQASAPAQVVCDDPVAAQGTGHWNSAREWVWQFDKAVPSGMRCNITLKKSFKSPSNALLAGATSYQFEVAGPLLERSWPSTWTPIGEDQFFVLRFSAPVQRDSLLQHSYCRSQDVGERIPLRWVSEQQAQDVLATLGLQDFAAQHPQRLAVVACNRRLTEGSELQLVYGAGVQTPSGVTNRKAKTLHYTVRSAFTANFSCEREQAQAGCMPIRALRLDFSAPVERQWLEQIGLSHQGKTIRPAPVQESVASSIEFAPALPADTSFELSLPAGLVDETGRPLVNAASFPLTVRTGPEPALAKFATAQFGVLERFAEGSDSQAAVLPLTVRRIEGLHQSGAAAQLRDLHVVQDVDIIAWWNRLEDYRWDYAGSTISRKRAQQDTKVPLPAPVQLSKEEKEEGRYPEVGEDYVSVRSISLLKGREGVQQVTLPKPTEGDPRPFEVVGVPLAQPGFHVVELESPQLGAALMDARMGAHRPMYVRTTALVTNLGVHLKLGKENSLVWVTTLDHGQPVAQAQVQVSSCSGQVHATGTTDAQGMLHLPDIQEEAPSCSDHGQSGSWFVSARTADDMSFVWSDWQNGIEPWRFNLPVGWSHAPELVAHTVMDRTLLRQGETVSMKHFVRRETGQGLALPEHWPSTAVLTHAGSGEEYRIAVQWEASPNGGQHASNHFAIPPQAKLGQYRIHLEYVEDNASHLYAGTFRVEAFRLPVLQGSVQPTLTAPLVQPDTVPVAVQLHYLNGGSANGQAVQVSAVLRSHDVRFERWRQYSFEPPTPDTSDTPSGVAPEEAERFDQGRLLADKLPVTLDAQGQGQVQLPALGKLHSPQELLLEASFADPNGEIQTLRSTHALWPAAVLPGILSDQWVASTRKLKFQAVAVDTQGNPQAGVPLKVEALLTTTTSTRKRLVGGFYSYDNQTQQKSLGTICSGKSDSAGLLLCQASLVEEGQVELRVTAQDGQGQQAQATTSVWVMGQGELWFGGQDHDRMDLLPEQTHYSAGQTARFQVRMPFREATALVTVEREGLLHSQVVTLKGDNPTLELPIQAGWGPNVYVSVLALRGRLYDVPWYSFFTWGFKAPSTWWKAFWHDRKDYIPPTAMVDLSKPAFRLGVAQIRVQDPSTQLKVQVSTDKARYQVREQAQVSIQVHNADGTPAAHAQVALAAVDKALLELMPNRSWNLTDGLWRQRDWSVSTATAQMEIVGRRHYGRKAAAPGGGGGSHAGTRELLDTLLLWQPVVQLDAQGRAQVTVPLNDALTSFDIVAIADAGIASFGTGKATIATTQDLQLISGLPPVVREGDQFTAMLTVRNTTEQAMQVRVAPQVSDLALQAQTIELPPGQAHTAQWPVQVPLALGQASEGVLHWHIQAKDKHSNASDALSVRQRLLPATPLAVQQATLVQVPASFSLDVEWPALAVPGKGGLRLSLSERLADPEEGVPGLRSWWKDYPYSCLEQTTSRAVGLNDAELWQNMMQRLPNYLDGDGLAMYFPPQGGYQPQGSDSLTAHLLMLSHFMQKIDPRFTLPAPEQARMEQALTRFVTGRLTLSRYWSPRQDHTARQLTAIAALALHHKATPAMLQNIELDPVSWPTHSLLDWLLILQQVQVPQREQHLEEAWQLLRNRLAFHGSQMVFTTEKDDYWWWLMQNSTVNGARLLLATMQRPEWDDERPRLVTGLLGRQERGHWGTTTANLWAGLALRQFSLLYEREDVTGDTTALLGASTQTMNWNALHAAQAQGKTAADTQKAQGQPSRLLPTGSTGLDAVLPPGTLFLPWGERNSGQLRVQHQGTGKPWMALQSLAAVPRTQAVNMGYTVRKTVTPLGTAQLDKLQRGDIVRVQLEVSASAGMTWVALTDPIPTGATILGSGLGRDSEIATQGENTNTPWWHAPTFVERNQDSYRAYWQQLREGTVSVQYTMRLNNAGTFALPATRVEALYAPEMFGEQPNSRWNISASPTHE